MPRRPRFAHRWLTAVTWPVGIALTSWDYMWRTTAMHRREVVESEAGVHMAPGYPSAVDSSEVQSVHDGVGPLFHRRYSVRICGSELEPERLMEAVRRDINAVAPTRFARFHRVLGEGDRLDVGDEYVVRMPGPWDGPVRVIDVGPSTFRLATLDGHLEAGQIEFRASSAGDGAVRFTIESWARSGDRFSDFLYHRVGMSKEIQLHMWISLLEGVGKISRGKIVGGIDIDTRRVDEFGVG
jgi:Domain of unknown function (DUF1990)